MLKKNRFRLFSYPLPDPKNTFYHKLGIMPEATAEEISVAQTEIKKQLAKQKNEVEKKLAEIYEKVDGIPQSYQDVERLRGQGKDVDTEELIKKEQHLAELEKEAIAVNSDYEQLRDRVKELDREINEINQLRLENPDNRFEYDKTTPPYALLKLEDCDQEVFSESENGRKLALYLLRLELSDFLAEKGEGSYHPSDLTRKDFSSDFTYNPILDGDNDDARSSST